MYIYRYQTMLSCWQEDPDKRPTFEALTHELKEMENQHKVKHKTRTKTNKQRSNNNNNKNGTTSDKQYFKKQSYLINPVLLTIDEDSNKGHLSCYQNRGKLDEGMNLNTLKTNFE